MKEALQERIIIDSSLSLEEALAQNPQFKAPYEILENLALVSVEYYSFDTFLHRGQMVVDISLVEDVKKVFEAIRKEKFPIHAVIPASDTRYKWDDALLMDSNITSAFNYRRIADTNNLSLHALGRAMDINPRFNPYIGVSGSVQPQGAIYDITRPGTISGDSFLVKLFEKLGWEWGGHWKDRKDYQHFQKKL